MAFRRFSPEERAWLASQRLGRFATVSPDGVVGQRAGHSWPVSELRAAMIVLLERARAVAMIADSMRTTPRT